MSKASLLEQFCSRNKVPYDIIESMVEEQKYPIKNLTERLNAIDMEKRAMMLILQDLHEQQLKDVERLAKLDDMLSCVEALKSSIKDERNKRKAAERKVKEIEAQLKSIERNN